MGWAEPCWMTSFCADPPNRVLRESVKYVRTYDIIPHTPPHVPRPKRTCVVSRRLPPTLGVSLTTAHHFPHQKLTMQCLGALLVIPGLSFAGPALHHAVIPTPLTTPNAGRGIRDRRLMGTMLQSIDSPDGKSISKTQAGSWYCSDTRAPSSSSLGGFPHLPCSGISTSPTLEQRSICAF
jgi:hypothetical protein